MGRLLEDNIAQKKKKKKKIEKKNCLALLIITVNLWVVHTHILMSTLEMENKPQLLIN